MKTSLVESGAPAPESDLDELVELGSMTEDTKGQHGTLSFDGGGGYFF